MDCSSVIAVEHLAAVVVCRSAAGALESSSGTRDAAIPPLGIIGWASPLSSAGVLFPGTGWFGIAVTALLPACLLLIPRETILTAAFASVVLNVGVRQPTAPADWEAVDTQFGNIAHGHQSPTAEFRVLSSLADRALRSPARVIIFPETVVPKWTEATDLFWEGTIEQLRLSGKTALLGVGLPLDQGEVEIPTYLNTGSACGAESGVVRQRIPVPLGMWQPVRSGGVPLSLGGSGVIEVAGERAGILICYEQLLVWPILRSLMERPTVLVGLANDHRAAGTTVPRCQRIALIAWSRLFRLPVLAAVNR